MTKIADLKKRLMDNPEFKAEYEKADAEFVCIEALIGPRQGQAPRVLNITLN